MKLRSFAIGGGLTALVLSGCMVGPKYSRTPMDVPPAYSEASALDTLPLVKWFDLFQDTVLKQIIHTTLQNNKDLLTATARKRRRWQQR